MRNVSALLLFLFPLLATLGCSSIHSKAVRSLIEIQTAKIDAANNSAAKLIKASQARAEAMTSSLNALNEAAKQQNTSEMIHALVFSANQNVASKTGVDAHAVTYLIGKLYLDEQVGLQKEINDQFAADIAAMEGQAVLIQNSWASLKDLNAKVEAFSKKSAFASIDPDFIKAVAAEIPGASSEIQTVLNDSQKANRALDILLKIPELNTPEVKQAQGGLNDLIDLLDKVKPTPKSGSQ